MHFWHIHHVWMLYLSVLCLLLAAWLDRKARQSTTRIRAAEYRQRALDVTHPYGQAPHTSRNPKGWDRV